MVSVVMPPQFPGGQRTRGNARILLQALGGLAGKSRTDNPISGCLPGFARRLHHRRLAGAGAAHDGGNPLWASDLLDGRFLLGR
ncbi:hypothetical protein D3C71_1524660 [compost metagenome]